MRLRPRAPPAARRRPWRRRTLTPESGATTRVPAGAARSSRSATEPARNALFGYRNRKRHGLGSGHAASSFRAPRPGPPPRALVAPRRLRVDGSGAPGHSPGTGVFGLGGASGAGRVVLAG